MSKPESMQEGNNLQLDGQQDVKVFELLFRNWFAPLCKVVFRMVKDKSLSEDLVQDVFVKTWNNRHKIDFSQPVKPYLYKAAINTALNHIESSKKNFSLDIMEHELPQQGDASIDQQVQYKEIQLVLEQTIDMLPPKCKAVFLLIKYEDMTYAEAAASLGISVKTVENQMGKALKHMREHMQEYVGYLLVQVWAQYLNQ
ncbi:MAG: RNA polymerase sigma-70 factor [Bacteroidota bacterium]|nr:RNA polymerase sigma-70 factor [Bacteroidota bacterium]